NRAIFVLHMNVVRNAIQHDVFGAGAQAKWSHNTGGFKVARVEIEISGELRKVHVGARGFEADWLGNARKFNALHEVAIQMHRALYIFNRYIVGAALNGNVGRDLRDPRGTVLQVERQASVQVAYRHIPVLASDLGVPITPHDTYVAMTRGCYQRSLARQGNVEIRANPVVAGSSSVGIQSHCLATYANLRVSRLVPFIGVFLALRINPFVH